MKLIFVLLSLILSASVFAQTQQSPEQIRAQMAKIRQTTNWDDPAAAQKANDEIRKLANLLTGNSQFSVASQKQQQNTGNIAQIGLKTNVPGTKENILAIVDRFFNRSYKALDAVSKTQFDQDYKYAENEKLSKKSVKKLTSMGAMLITFGNDHNLACVYLTSALKALPDDTLAANNFGGYLRVVDSIAVSLPVLLYANSLFDESPIILTQIGCSYMELGDKKQGENYLKQAVKINPDFGQAHSALCDLYISQNRLEDAIHELFAGVKGMGVSYTKASQNYTYMQQQAENSDTREDFRDETRKQLNPDDALSPLVPEDNRLKMPKFEMSSTVADWMDGGGYLAAVQATNGFVTKLSSFSKEFLEIHKQVPVLPPNAILRDYPSERFALDCITEYFFHESQKESDKCQEKMDEIIDKIGAEAEDYFSRKEQWIKELENCLQGCRVGDVYCSEECRRVYCTKDCPATILFNGSIERYFKDYKKAFQDTKTNQERILDDLYAFTEQWFSQIKSEYWSRIYAYEIQRVALSVIGNTYAAYSHPYSFPAHSVCGTDCSVYANPFLRSLEEVEEKKPQANNCPKDWKASLGIGFCGIDLECESIEFGCSAGVSMSVKRDFKNKNSTLFIGAGGELDLVGASAGIKAGVTITRADTGEITDVGGKLEMGGSVGPLGKNYEMTATIMEGSRFESKNVVSF